jgi:hypothetical protein
MAVAVVITAVSLTGNGVSATGTVAGGQPITIQVDPDLLVGLTLAEIQLVIAVKLAQVAAAAAAIPVASLTGTVNL